MAEDIKVSAESRKERGTAPARRLRAKGLLPAILYGAGNPTALPIVLKEHEFDQLLKHHTSEHLIMDLEVDGVPKKVLLKDVQHHPVSGGILHADFLEVSMTERLRVTIPVELIGDPEGVVKQGGIVEHLIREIEVECLPADVVELVNVDISHLKIGEGVFVSDIPLDKEKYEILTAADIAVASVAAPRVQEEEAGVESAESAVAEPVMIKEKKEE
ncbi:MAG: 50S ribosomal protein L25 [Spartobacteria bacterium]|nr:50S ribosomal protein L25 [Spartobacteria bacterium]